MNKQCQHLSTEELETTLSLLKRFEYMYNNKLGTWNTALSNLELKEGEKPVCCLPYFIYTSLLSPITYETSVNKFWNNFWSVSYCLFLTIGIDFWDLPIFIPQYLLLFLRSILSIYMRKTTVSDWFQMKLYTRLLLNFTKRMKKSNHFVVHVSP